MKPNITHIIESSLIVKKEIKVTNGYHTHFKINYTCMKTILSLLLLSLFITYPVYSQNISDTGKQKEEKMSRAERKAAKAAEIAKDIEKYIANKKFYIEIYKIFPQGESPKIVSGSYSFRFSNDSISFLFDQFLAIGIVSKLREHYLEPGHTSISNSCIKA